MFRLTQWFDACLHFSQYLVEAQVSSVRISQKHLLHFARPGLTASRLKPAHYVPFFRTKCAENAVRNRSKRLENSAPFFRHLPCRIPDFRAEFRHLLCGHRAPFVRKILRKKRTFAVPSDSDRTGPTIVFLNGCHKSKTSLSILGARERLPLVDT